MLRAMERLTLPPRNVNIFQHTSPNKNNHSESLSVFNTFQINIQKICLACGFWDNIDLLKIYYFHFK